VSFSYMLHGAMGTLLLLVGACLHHRWNSISCDDVHCRAGCLVILSLLQLTVMLVLSHFLGMLLWLLS